MSKNTQISELINYISVDGSGNIVFTTIPTAATNTGKFLVSDAGVLKFRTAAQLLSDIGAQASGSYQPALSGTGFVKISGSTISYDNSTYLTSASLTSYIPYTGATAAVNLGNYNLTIKEIVIGTGAKNNTNIAIGRNVMSYSSGGTGNVAIGVDALYFDQSDGSVVIGYEAGYYSNQGRNVTIGYQAGRGNGPGSNSIAVGYQALLANTNGSSNIAIGYLAGSELVGSNNTIIGGYLGTTMSSNVVIADGAGNIRFQWDGSNIKLNGNTVGSNAYTSTAYLPLAGGTLSGPLTGTTSIWNGYAINATPPSVGTAQTFVRYISAGSDWYIGSEGSVAGNFFGGASAYASVFFGTNPFQFITAGVKRFEIATSGISTTVGFTGTTGTFSGAISATYGTFTSQVTVASPFTIKDTNPYIQWQNSSATRLGYIQHATNLVMSADSGNVILTTTSGTFTLTSAGPATFSSSVQATDFRYTNTGYITYDTANTGNESLIIRKFGTTVLTLDSISRATFASTVFIGGNLHFDTNGTVRTISNYGYGGSLQLLRSDSTSTRWARIGMVDATGTNFIGGMTINNDTSATFSSNITTTGTIIINSRTVYTTAAIYDNASAGNNVGIGFGPNSILPITGDGTASNGTKDLGSSSVRWSTVYTSDLSLSNGIGDYTIVEGENDLFLYNNKQNKVYKFMLAEVDPAYATPKKS